MTGDGSGSGDDGQTSTTGHPLGWSCGDGIVVTGEYCFRELRLEGVDVVAVVLGDLNGDGRADVVVQTPDELRSYMIRDDGSFELLAVWGDGRDSGVTLFVGDFSGDGRRDVVRLHHTEIALFVQGAGGSIVEPPLIATTNDVGYPYGVLDIDRDGTDELLVLGQEVFARTPPRVTGIEVHDGAWAHIELGFEFWLPTPEWAFGDIDGDGIIDPATVMEPEGAIDLPPYIPETFDTKSAHLGWLQPDGSGVALGATLTPGFHASRIDLGDLDGDGRVDVVLLAEDPRYDYDEPSPLKIIYWGRGDWQFDGPHELGDIWGKVVDLEGDGVEEIANKDTSTDRYEVWFYSGSAFTFTPVETPICTTSKGAADINEDGVMDCAEAHHGSLPTSAGSGSLVVLLSDP
ncbi:FG-GAP repeat domain-containing protein [Paraliomyxa miuraensis]|uniref:FG-GAP repeat domain-containing protein n=1 Tax=Paraliomyxa miuraensis TaxID=376150 RepID=UPI002252EECA|nr:VCBS repeat-containing protein [Paraliomyxa miuraensis]